MDFLKHRSGLKRLTKKRAVLELSVAAILWGFGFIASIWALESFSPSETLLFRFLIAATVGELVYLFIRWKFKKTMPREEILSQLKLAFPAGLLLGGMLLLQTIGLKYTTATKSSFITCLYIILVPFVNFIFFKSKIGWNSFAFVLLALAGTYLLVGGPIDNINAGDIWTLACAVFAAFHIIYIGKINNKISDAFRFNNMQSLWCLLAAIPFVFSQTKTLDLNITSSALIGLVCLGIGSSVVAFYLQIRAQKSLDDTTASMLFLLESPVAALFGFILLSERLNTLQTLGALLILSSAALQVLFSKEKS